MIRFITLFALVAFATPALAGGNPNAVSRARAASAEREAVSTSAPRAEREVKTERVDPTSNSQLIGRPTMSLGPCAFVLDSEHVAARRIPETAEAMRSLGVDCLDAGTRQLDGQTRRYEAETSRAVALDGLSKGIDTVTNGKIVATGPTASAFTAISLGNNSMFMPGMMMPGLGQMGTLALQSAAMGTFTPPPATPAPSTTSAAAVDARMRALESENTALRAANDALSGE